MVIQRREMNMVGRKMRIWDRHTHTYVSRQCVSVEENNAEQILSVISSPLFRTSSPVSCSQFSIVHGVLPVSFSDHTGTLNHCVIQTLPLTRGALYHLSLCQCSFAWVVGRTMALIIPGRSGPHCDYGNLYISSAS